MIKCDRSFDKYKWNKHIFSHTHLSITANLFLFISVNWPRVSTDVALQVRFAHAIYVRSVFFNREQWNIFISKGLKLSKNILKLFGSKLDIIDVNYFFLLNFNNKGLQYLSEINNFSINKSIYKSINAFEVNLKKRNDGLTLKK